MSGRRVRLTWQDDPTLYDPARYRQRRYEAYVPDPLKGQDLRLGTEVMGAVSDAEAAIHDLNAWVRPALAPIARLLLRTESIASSRLGGMRIEVGELARAEARMASGGNVGRPARDILANIEAMELAIGKAASARPFSTAQIIAIHRKLMECSLNAGIAGEIRTVQNWIGGNDYDPHGADYVPPPPPYLDELLEDLSEAINDDLMPPLVQAALVHAQFETIHPFHDGNGRIGRALIHAILRRRGIAHSCVTPISVVLASSREGYIAGLGDYREDRVEAWVQRFALAAAGAARLASDYLDAVEELRARWRARLADSHAAPRSDAAAWAIIDVLPAHPTITASIAAAATGRSRPQIYVALTHLENAGVLIPLSRARRNRSWEPVGLLDLLVRREAGLGP